MRRKVVLTLLTLWIAGIISVSGCASSPSSNQIIQLNELQAEISTLEQKVNKLNQEKAKLQASVEEKEVKLVASRAEENMIEEKLRNNR
jgi:outer membrane murein-binding lipoprotein Lpp